MATQDDDDKDKRPETAEPLEADQASLVVSEPADLQAASEVQPTAEEGVPTQIGTQRYVHAAFFVAGILLAYISSKFIGAAWSSLADWPAAVRAVPLLVSYPEDERETFTLIAGAVIGVATIVQIYRRERIRHWADEVAAELGRVVWPNREAVVNGTVVVVIASTIAAVYVAILDRFWGFLTTLVYGA